MNKKKLLNVVLLSTLFMVFAGAFVSCKDYDDDIKGLQEQIDKKGDVTAMDSQINSLKTALDAATKAANNAKEAAAKAQAAADAAKAVGDEALAKAKQADANAQKAIQAAAEAKKEALEAVKKEVEALKVLLEKKIDGKVDQEVYDAAIAAINGKIEGIQEGLGKLTERVVKNEKDIKDINDAIQLLQKAKSDMSVQIEALEKYRKISEDKDAEHDQAIKDLKADLKKANEKIADLETRVFAETKRLEGLINNLDTELKKLAKTVGGLDEGLKKINKEFTEFKDATNKTIKEIKDTLVEVKADIKAINAKITDEIIPDLAMLHTMITSRLTSITFAPSYFYEGVEALSFNSLVYSGMTDNENAEIPSIYTRSTSNLTTASYHFNPASFDLKNADYQFIDRKAEVLRALEASALVQIEGVPEVNAEQGTVDFKVRRLNASKSFPRDDNKYNILALQATLKKEILDKDETNVVVTSPYVLAYDNFLNHDNVRIADKETLVKKGENAHYALTFDAAKKENPRYEMAYNKVFNLKELVATCFNDGKHHEMPIEDFNLSYRFYVASSKYDIEQGTVTNQQEWIKCNDAEEGLYQAENFNKEAIGRTPILKVELVDAEGLVVRRGFVKVQIVAKKADDLTVGEGVKFEPVVFQCADTKAKFEITEQYIRENVYRALNNGDATKGISHEEFWNIYEVASTKVTKNGVELKGIDQPKTIDGPSTSGVATKKVVWEFTHGQVGKIGRSGTKLVGTLVLRNKLASSEYPAHVTFKFNVNFVLPTFKLNAVENKVFWELDEEKNPVAFKVNVAVPKAVDSPDEDCIFSRDLDIAYSTFKVKWQNNACAETYYEVAETFSNGKVTTTPLEGVVITKNIISLDKTNAAVKEALNSKGGLQAMVVKRARLNNGNIIDINAFMVKFIRPITLNMPSGLSVVDATTGGDLIVGNFQHNNLITDWRGESVFEKSWTFTEVQEGYWMELPQTPEVVFVPGHYGKMISKAIVNVEYDKVSFTINGDNSTMYTGSVTYKFTAPIIPAPTEKPFYKEETVEFTVDGYKLTKDEVARDLEAQVAIYAGEYGATSPEMVGEITYTSKNVASGTTVEYTYVKSIEYIPAEYEWVEDAWVTKPLDYEHMPLYKGKTEGEYSPKKGWRWSMRTTTDKVQVPGQYWDFYGPFAFNYGIGYVKLDLEHLTTNLDYNGGKLPEKHSMRQDGSDLYYNNGGSPVGYEYIISIPATVTYGWGTVGSTLNINVKPVQK